jgi:surfactin synthase thioesterase subunit
MAKTADMANEVVSEIRNFMGQVPGKAAELKTSALHGAENAFDALAAQIKKHPFAALGIAFGIGYLAMRIARR